MSDLPPNRSSPLQMNCLLGDAGIAIGLTSLPFRQEIEFYTNEIANSLFPNYKRAVLDNFASPETSSRFDSEFHKHFYEPVPYYLFGSFDLAVITLIDDFEMMARTFRPFDPMLSADAKKKHRENFFYKVITGPTPQFRPDDSIVRVATSTFLRDDRAPLFVMSLLKLNNALLLGTGTEFLRRVVRFIKAAAKRQQALTPNLQVVLLESYSSNEITLLVFTDSYSSAAQLITSIRETRVRDLLKAGDDLALSEDTVPLLQNCLLTDLAATEADKQNISVTSVFADTESYFGFDFRALDPAHRSLLDRIDAKDTLDMLCQWSIRPGHLRHSIDELVQEHETEVSGCIGRGDIIEQTSGLSTRQLIERLLESLKPQSPPRNAKRRQTMPKLAERVVSALPIDRDTSLEYEEPDLRSMAFSVSEITEIQDHLRAVWAPKILTGKVLNAFTNFNDGILDPALFGYFIELLPLMELIQQTVATWHETPDETTLGTICETLEKVTDNFERAYRNRFYNSYRMGDITDFNLDFKGGIQQLLTSFDAAYKAICSLLGRSESFVYVAGSPGVYSTRHEVRLNYYHVFQPEIFACIANHEAANFYLARPTSQEVPWFARTSGLIPAEDVLGPANLEVSVLDRLDKMRSRADWEQTELLCQVTPRLFNYIFVDLLALYFGYNRNGDLFAHWYWGYFAQNSFAYSRSEQVDLMRFVGFMLRMLWIERISSVPQGGPIKFGMESFDELWRQWRPILNDFLDWLWQDDALKRWNDEVISHVESTFLDVHGLSEAETIVQICERIEKDAAKLREKLKRGEVCLYSRVNDKSMFKFTETLFYAYLSLLADRFGEGEILLTRSDDGRPKVKPSNAKALFDPIGGIFTHDPRTRRERFRYRAGLTMSLWDMGQKEKKRLVLARLRREQTNVVA